MKILFKVLLVLAVLVASIPSQIIGKILPYGGDILIGPLMVFAFLILFFAPIKLKFKRGLFLGLLLWGTILYYLNYPNGLLPHRYYFLELGFFCAFFAGFSLFDLLKNNSIDFVLTFFKINLICVTITQIGITAGLIPAMFEQTRIMDPMMFYNFQILVTLFPFMFVRKMNSFWPTLALVILFWFGVASATRNILLQFLICLIEFVICFRGFARIPVWLKCIIGGTIFGVIFLALRGLLFEHFLEARGVEEMRKVGFDEENIRWYEIMTMYDQMTISDLVFGKGIGSHLYSPIYARSENEVTYAPHMAIFAPIMKFGILFTVSLWVYIFTKILKLLKKNDYLALVPLNYLIGASVSGGWGFLVLFSLGIGVGYLFYSERTISNDRLGSWAY
jgi:hypothetical protein